MLLLGFDPGRDKCGLALVNHQQTILLTEVINAEAVLARVEQWRDTYGVDKIVIGNQTTSQQWQQQLMGQFPDLPIVMVNERNSTLQARDRYWELYPPRGIMRLIPKGMRLPPRPVDDLVAVLLVERALHSCQSFPN